MCTNGNSEARASRWFRGIRTADANGRVDFNTCFPGWYSSRTIHIHFTVRANGTEYLTSQLFFDDALNNEIISSQPIYSARGAKDTTNASDNVLRQSGLSDFTFQTQKMDDGAMLAWKAIVIKA
jgi:protocatechuate 3,4-dioxygenase beta subunit